MNIFDTMKKLLIKLAKIGAVLLIFVIALFYIIDLIIMPSVVERDEVLVPNVKGKHKEEVLKLFEELNLEPVLEGPIYDENFNKDFIIKQNPDPGSAVKVGRRIYLYVSGGEPLIKMPDLVGRSIRDAKVTIERLGLEIDTIYQVRSEYPAETIVEQDFAPTELVPKSSPLKLKVSIGPQLGMIKVPTVLGKSLKEGEKILRNNSLRLGKIIYQPSQSLLPNTIIDQIPSESKLLSVGDSVDVVVTQSISR